MVKLFLRMDVRYFTYDTQTVLNAISVSYFKLCVFSNNVGLSESFLLNKAHFCVNACIPTKNNKKKYAKPMRMEPTTKYLISD